jgi:hypothetical protein
MGSWEERVR